MEKIYLYLNLFLTLAISFYAYQAGSAAANACGVDELHPWLAGPKNGEQLTNRISEDQIHVYSNRVVILGNFTWSGYTDTNSMLPLLDTGAHGINLPVQADTTLYVGEIISFKQPGGEGVMIHRIINKSYDEDGLFYLTKGDSNEGPDGIKIRPDEVQTVLVGVIW